MLSQKTSAVELEPVSRVIFFQHCIPARRVSGGIIDQADDIQDLCGVTHCSDASSIPGRPGMAIWCRAREVFSRALPSGARAVAEATEVVWKDSLCLEVSFLPCMGNELK